MVGAGCGIATVLAAASPAEAILYTFTSAGFTSSAGNGTITGTFDWTGTSGSNGTINTWNVSTTNPSLINIPATSSGTAFQNGVASGTASWNASTNRLEFTRITPTGNSMSTNTITEYLRIYLDPDLSPNQNFTSNLSQFASGGLNYCNVLSGSGSGKCSNNPTTLAFSAVSGSVKSAVPSPLSFMMLAPLSSLLVLRRRFRPLTARFQLA